MNNEILCISNLYKQFGKQEVLKGVDFKVNKGDVISIIGPSGCGKSTLLRCINLLEVPTAGEIIFENKYLFKNQIYFLKKHLKNLKKNTPEYNQLYNQISTLKKEERLIDKNSSKNINSLRKRIGMVFQQFNLFPHLTVLENLTIAPVSLNNIKKSDAEKKALALLDKVGLIEYADKFPTVLSGGQKQRVAIGRALALNPKMICFDEPTSALDPSLTKDVANLIKSLSKNGMSMLIITHDMSFAKLVSNKILSMDSGVLINKHIYTEEIEFA